jgi:hypothetical protein
MAREYTHIKVLEKEILAMRESGKTNREIAEHFGFKDKYVVKGLIKRINQTERKKEAGILPKVKGRPRKKPIEPESEKDNEIRRLRMENELLRDFVRLAGRK